MFSCSICSICSNYFSVQLDLQEEDNFLVDNTKIELRTLVLNAMVRLDHGINTIHIILFDFTRVDMYNDKYVDIAAVCCITFI